MGDTGSFSDKDNCPLSAVIGEGSELLSQRLWVLINLSLIMLDFAWLLFLLSTWLFLCWMGSGDHPKTFLLKTLLSEQSFILNVRGGWWVVGGRWRVVGGWWWVVVVAPGYFTVIFWDWGTLYSLFSISQFPAPRSQDLVI